MNRNRLFKTVLPLLMLASGAASLHAVDYPRIILALHPAAYYRLDDPPGVALARDSSAARVNAMVNAGGGGQSTPQPGISTNSAVFTGGANSPSITIPYSISISPVNTDGLTGAPFSCECWVRPTIAVAPSPLTVLAVAGVATGGSYPNGSGWDLSEAGSPATWQLKMRSQNGLVNLTSSDSVALSQWSHLAVTWDGTTAKFYVNGVASQSKTIQGYLAVPNFSGTIGSGPNNGGGNFQGAVAEVVFYDYTLRPAAISNHFAVGSATLSARATFANP